MVKAINSVIGTTLIIVGLFATLFFGLGRYPIQYLVITGILALVGVILIVQSFGE